MQPVLKIIVYIILFLLPAVLLIRDWKFDDKRSRPYRFITYIVLVASIILLIPSALFIYLDIREASRTQQEMQDSQMSLIRRADEQAEAQRQLRDKSDQIAALYQRIAHTQSEIAQSQHELRTNAEEQANVQLQLRKKSDEIAALNKVLAAKSDEIANLNRDIAANVTGGDGYCYLVVIEQGELASKANPDIVELRLERVGKYPLYDVDIRIYDVRRHYINAFRHLNTQGAKDYLSMPYSQRRAIDSAPITQISVGNLSTRQTDNSTGQNWVSEVQPIQLKLTGDDPQFYRIDITARNGLVAQNLNFRRVNGEWKKAVRVFFNRKKIQESADQDFPRDDKGQIQWVIWREYSK